jgi:hypothetical protein
MLYLWIVEMKREWNRHVRVEGREAGVSIPEVSRPEICIPPLLVLTRGMSSSELEAMTDSCVLLTQRTAQSPGCG